MKHSAVLLVLSDGGCQYAKETMEVVNRLKSDTRLTLCAALFNKRGENDAAGREMLRGIVTNPVLDFKDIYDAETLRSFFDKSISRASGGIVIA